METLPSQSSLYVSLLPPFLDLALTFLSPSPTVSRHPTPSRPSNAHALSHAARQGALHHQIPPHLQQPLPSGLTLHDHHHLRLASAPHSRQPRALLQNNRPPPALLHNNVVLHICLTVLPLKAVRRASRLHLRNGGSPILHGRFQQF